MGQPLDDIDLRHQPDGDRCQADHLMWPCDAHVLVGYCRNLHASNDHLTAILVQDGFTPCCSAFDPAMLQAMRDLRSQLVLEHGHEGDAFAPWPSCLPVHMALNRAKEVLG